MFDGQSLSITPIGGRPYPTQLVTEKLSGAHGWVDVAIDGTTYAQRAATLAARVDSQANVAPTVVYLDDGGTSDLLGGMSAVDLMTVVTTNAADRRAAGFDKIVRATIWNFPGMTGGQNTERLAFNTAIRASNAFDLVADFAADATLGDPLNAGMTYDNGHLNDAGADRAATVLAAALATIGIT